MLILKLTIIGIGVALISAKKIMAMYESKAPGGAFQHTVLKMDGDIDINVSERITAVGKMLASGKNK